MTRPNNTWQDDVQYRAFKDGAFVVILLIVLCVLWIADKLFLHYVLLAGYACAAFVEILPQRLAQTRLGQRLGEVIFTTMIIIATWVWDTSHVATNQ